MTMDFADLSQNSLKNLKVAQLKLLCKERHISGYSKLAKDGLISMLLRWKQQKPVPTSESAGSSDVLVSDTPFISKTTKKSPTERNSNNDSTSTKTVVESASPSTTLFRSIAIELASKTPLATMSDSISPTLADICAKICDIGPIVTRDSDAGTSRHKSKDQRSSKTYTSEELCPPATLGCLNVSSSTANPTLLSNRASDESEPGPTAKKKAKTFIVGNSSIVPAQKTLLLSSQKFASSKMANQLIANHNNSEALLASEKVSSNRFKPLMAPVGPTANRAPASSSYAASDRSQITSKQSKLNNSSLDKLTKYLDFEPSVFTTPLKAIGFPPSVSQRKRVPRLALILSQISFQDLKVCALVSRYFRYSAFLAATGRLSRNFSGKRLESIISRYSPNMTNFWPYLLHREEEAATRRRIYEASSLGRALKGLCNLKKELWSSPDNEKQANIAVRFLLTKMFFYVSTGHGADDFTGAMDCRLVLNAEEVIPDEIWKITFRSLSSIQVFYVLEATCEVIGQVDVTSSIGPLSFISTLRADWSHYITARLELKSETKPDNLWDHVQWTNHEEYDRGISRHWLSRVQKKDDVGLTKVIVARRYILACLVSNSVSGTWLTSNEMQQDFDGVLQKQATRERKSQRVNLFLPAHHHVESVHFTSSNGKSLHPALAVVQTPAREYFILKDNGMQVGCEEDGIAPVWIELLS